MNDCHVASSTGGGILFNISGVVPSALYVDGAAVGGTVKNSSLVKYTSGKDSNGGGWIADIGCDEDVCCPCIGGSSPNTCERVLMSICPEIGGVKTDWKSPTPSNVRMSCMIVGWMESMGSGLHAVADAGVSIDVTDDVALDDAQDAFGDGVFSGGEVLAMRCVLPPIRSSSVNPGCDLSRLSAFSAAS